MIKIKNLSKKFKDKYVLKDINLDLPKKGMVFFLGDSGCGKTTLLNCIAGLLDYEGEIIVDYKNLRVLNEKEKDYFRLTKLGFIFQDFRLFINDTVYENVILPIQCLGSNDKTFNDRKALDLIELVDLKDKTHCTIGTLSGGEKQRVSIARSLANDPSILLCDEPTGSLDSVNSIRVMEVLRKVASNHLVVVVSHDKELAFQFANEIYRFKDGKIIDSKKQSNTKQKNNLPILRNGFVNKKPILPLSFCVRHSLNFLKKKKIRTAITNFVTSLGLMGIGLSFVLSDIIKNNIMRVYSSVIEDNQVVVSLNYDKNDQEDIVGIKYEDAFALSNTYHSLIDGVGICYYAPFEDYFPTLNEICLANVSNRLTLSSYSVRNINEYVWLDDCVETMYPFAYDKLENDEIIMSFSIFEIQQICYALRIQRTVEALSYYIDTNSLYVCLDVANIDWQYEDQQIFEVKAFTISNTPTIYHSSQVWNEYILEERMRFPTNYNTSEEEYYPWVMKKIPYLKTKGDLSLFLENTYSDFNLAKYIFEPASITYYPWLYDGVDRRFIDRILVFENNVYSISPNDYIYFKQIEPRVQNPIFSSYGGYSIYGSAMLVGFSNPTFFSSSLDDLNETTSIYDSADLENNDAFVLPSNVLQGHYSKSVFDGVTIRGYSDKKVIGNIPSSVDEILISKGMSEKLFNGLDCIGKEIYISFLVETLVDVSGNKLSVFDDETLKIVGYIEDNKSIIYQSDFWTLNYFLSRLDVSAFNLFVSSMTLECSDRGAMDEIMVRLSKEFPQYDFANPLKEISSGIDELCFYLEIVLFILSMIAIVISIFLITINDYLHVLERKKDIGLLRCLGVNKKSAASYLYTHSFIISLFAFAISCLELFIISLFGNVALAKLMNLPFIFSFSIIPYLVMFVVSLLAGLIPAYLISYKLNKFNPLEALKN